MSYASTKKWREAHPEKVREFNRERVERARRLGFCIRCNKRKVSGGHTTCRRCMQEIREDHLQKAYGLSLPDVEQRRKIQRNRCGICRKKFTDTPRVDHDHKTGKNRDLLCDACNRGLACFRDNLKILRNAAKYIKKHRRAK